MAKRKMFEWVIRNKEKRKSYMRCTNPKWLNRAVLREDKAELREQLAQFKKGYDVEFSVTRHKSRMDWDYW